MAVQKSRKTPSKRGMRRSHDSLKPESLSMDVATMPRSEKRKGGIIG